MKPKEAIIQLMCAGGQDQLVVDALDLAIEALEKQVTKKPLSENKYYFTGKCPSCGAVFWIIQLNIAVIADRLLIGIMKRNNDL